jgi:hypothetical protein
VAAEKDETEEDSVQSDSGLDWAASGGQPYAGKSQGGEPGVDEEGTWREEDISAVVSSARYSNFNTALADSILELHAVDIVELLNDLRAQDQKNRITDKVRQNWLKSARILLVAHGRPHEEVLRLIRWVCADEHWSRRINSVYKLGESYEAILKESQLRKPRRGEVKPVDGKNHASHTEDGSAKPLDGHRSTAAVSFSSLADL